MATFLAIDYGLKRIGLAVGDDGSTVATPLRPIAGTGRVEDDVRAVLRAAEAYDLTAFVVGLPLNMDGTEGDQARLSRRFGDALARAAAKPVHYVDERLSSFAAEELVQPLDLSRKKRKARLDSIAAQTILNNFLDRRHDG